jgi:DNA-binding CsgD family transcriptional regulator
MDNCSGVVELDQRGEASVELPWRDGGEELDLTYQLTCVGGFAPVFVIEEPGKRSFRISGGRPGISISWMVRGHAINSPADALPPRVRETLAQLMTGASDKEIARRLGISHNTVRQYVRSLLRAYRVESRLQLVSTMLARCACGAAQP